jgi:hypothetical protein
MQPATHQRIMRGFIAQGVSYSGQSHGMQVDARYAEEATFDERTHPLWLEIGVLLMRCRYHYRRAADAQADSVLYAKCCAHSTRPVNALRTCSPSQAMLLGTTVEVRFGSNSHGTYHLSYGCHRVSSRLQAILWRLATLLPQAPVLPTCPQI